MSSTDTAGSRVIRVDSDVWNELQKRATPLTDTPNSVIRRLLGLHERRDKRRRADAPCPQCGECNPDKSERQGDGNLYCTMCGTLYDPSDAE